MESNMESNCPHPAEERNPGGCVGVVRVLDLSHIFSKIYSSRKTKTQEACGGTPSTLTISLTHRSHGIFSSPAAQRLQDSGIREVIVTDTLPIPPENQFANLTILPIAPLLARAIKEVFDEGSVASLFDHVGV